MKNGFSLKKWNVHVFASGSFRISVSVDLKIGSRRTGVSGTERGYRTSVESKDV